jgi:DNA-binding response OmpR family regulator
MRILVIEDEEKIGNLIHRGLKQHKWVVDLAKDGEEGSFMAEVNPYDAIILDLMLPKKDGLSLCRELRKKDINTPILMLTSRSAVKDKIQGLDAGADDYLSKPFAFGELTARIRSLLRRQREKKIEYLKVDDLEMNLLTYQTTRGGKGIPLTTKEFMLLEYFMLNAGQVLTRTMISEHVWHENFNSLTNVIDVHIKYLRNKVDNGFRKKLIHTVRGSGYVLKDEQKKTAKKKR